MINDTKLTGITSILVVEDKCEHIDAAEEQLSHYKLTIAKNFEEYLDHINLYSEQSAFDVVLTDLNFPFESSQEEMPLGYSAIMVAARKGLKYAGIVTASNHHQGPIEESLIYYKAGREGSPFKINDTQTMFFDDDVFRTRNKPKRWDLALEYLVTGAKPTNE